MISSNAHYYLTLDIDWCPDYMLERVVQMLIENEVHATFFVTHPTPILKLIERCHLFELGIHPNFLPNSSHGNDIDTIYKYVLKLAPNAFACRSHGLVISTNHVDYLLKNTNIKLELSNLAPFMINPNPIKYEQLEKSIDKLPYVFDDYYVLRSPYNFNQALEKIFLSKSGHHVLNFHPVHLYLNTSSVQKYDQLKPQIFHNNTQLNWKYFCSNFGIQDYFFEFMQKKQVSFSKLSTIINL